MQHSYKRICGAGLLFSLTVALAYCLIHCQIIRLASLDSFFLTAGFAGSFWVYADFFLQHQWNWRHYSLLGSVIFFLIVFLSILFCIPPVVCALFVFCIWLFAGMHFLVRIIGVAENRSEAMHYFFLFLALPLFILISDHFLLLSGKTNPLVWDEYLMATDGTLGIYPCLLIGRFIQALPEEIQAMLKLIYCALPLAFIMVYCRRYCLEKAVPLDLILDFIFIGIFGYLLYNVIPGCGSSFAFHATWPQGLPSDFLQTHPEPIQCPVYLPRNCLPSLHTAWIVCLVRRARVCDAVTRVLIWCLVPGTFIAMFGPGAHYLVDIVVGFAFANCLGGLSEIRLPWRNQARMRAVMVGGLLCVLWYVVILKGLALLQLSHGLAWAFFVGSVLTSFCLERCLAKAVFKTRDGLNALFLNR